MALNLTKMHQDLDTLKMNLEILTCIEKNKNAPGQNHDLKNDVKIIMASKIEELNQALNKEICPG